MVRTAFACVFVVTIFTLTYILAVRPETAQDCSVFENPYLCYTETTRSISNAKGAEEGLVYVRQVIIPNAGYFTAHMALHEVGKRAYAETGSVDAALRRVLVTKPGTEEYYTGYMHGVFQAFFVENSLRTTAGLAETVCKEYTQIESPDDPKFTTIFKSYAIECYHGVGHAVMLIHDNSLDTSLAACDTLQRQWMQEWCYHGVFMENQYLLRQAYEPDSPRPDASIISLLPTCQRLDLKYRPQCVYLMGWVHYTIHGAQFAAAFAECKVFPSELARICVARIGRSPVVRHYGDDFEHITTTCAAAEPFQSECLFAAAIGLSQGIAGLEKKQAGKLLCERLSDSKAGCHAAIERMNESYARFVVTEL